MPAFTPTDISGLSVWLKADALVLSDADPVSSWTDSSGNARHATQATSGARPTYRTGVVNAKPVVRFDGTDDWLSAAFTLNQPYTMLVVAKHNVFPGTQQDILDGGNGNPVPFRTQSTQRTIYAGTFLTLAAGLDTSWHIAQGTYSGAASSLRVDGGAGASGVDIGNLAAGGVTVGASFGGGQPFNGDVAEVLVYNKALSAYEIEKCGLYLAAKYALTWTSLSPQLPFYLKETAASGSAHLSLQEGGAAPTAATTTTGWIVGTATATKYARMDSSTERASAAHTATVEPSSGPDNTLGDCFRSEDTYSGSFAAANWSFSIPVQGETRATSTHGGKLRIRVWRSTSATGASATEITTSTEVTSSYTSLANSAAQTLTLTWAGPAVSLAGEYLFIQVAHQLDVAGNNANSDTHLRVGSTSTVTTAAFTPTAGSSVTTTDSLTTSDAAARAATAGRTSTDARSTSDAVTRTTAAVRTISDSSSTSDAATAVVVRTRTVADTLSPSDLATRTTTAARTVANAAAGSDSVTASRAGARTTSESLTTADVAIKGTTQNRSSADAVSASDAAGRTTSASRAGAESLTTSSTFTRSTTGSRAASDSSSTADTAGRVSATIGRATAESLTTTVAAGRSSQDVRTATEAVTAGDAATRAASGVRTTADSLTTTSSATTGGGQVRTANSSLTTTDASGRSIVNARATSDSVAGNATVSRVLATARTVTETTTTAMTAPRIASAFRSASSSLATTDAASRIAVTSRAGAESTTTAVAGARFVLTARSAAEITSTSSTATVTTSSRLRTTTDSLTTADGALRSGLGGRIAVESLTTTDVAVSDFVPLGATWRYFDGTGSASTADGMSTVSNTHEGTSGIANTSLEGVPG